MKDDDLKIGLEQDVTDGLKEFLNKKLFEEKLHFFTGKVEDVNDPDKQGRCKVRVYNVFEPEIPTVDLPWAKPDQGFIGSKVGSFIVPPKDTLVKVYFDNGDMYSPFYTTKAFNIKSANLSSIPSSDYPNIMVMFETDEGESYTINRATRESVFTHASGLTIKFGSDGNVEMASNEAGTGNLTIKMKGDINLISESGNISLAADSGKILLGGDAATQAVPNVPTSFFNGAPVTISQQLPGTPGAVYLRP